jgi:hypothetical protein
MNKYNEYLESDNWEFVPYSKMEDGGMTIRKIGGKGTPTVEVEGKEHIQLPNGFSQEIQGASHANGGIALNLPEGSKVFSENLKDPQTKKSYADLAKKFETKKNYDMLNSKRGDAIQKSTAEMMIKFKNNKLNDLFSMQEEDKMSGVHGLKPMMETMQNQQPMAKYGMKLPKAQSGYRQLNPEIKGKAKKVATPISDYNFIDEEGNKVYYGKETPGKPGKAAQKITKFMTNEQWKEYLKKETPEKKAARLKRQQGIPATPASEDYIYTEKEPAKKVEETITPETKTEYKTEYIYEKPEIGFDLSIPLPGNVYGRSPLNYYQIEPDYIDPRYLDVQPQLNQVARGQRAIQSNLGGRGSTDIANMLQAQANADTQRGQVYGQKYNYDRAQDAAAQQYNAGMKSQTDMFNQGTWFNQLENPIRQREGAIDTQQRTDQQNAIENMRRSQAFSRNENFINDTYKGLQNLTPEQRNAIIFGNTAFNDANQKTTTKTDNKGNVTKTETVSSGKHGGKIKIKPKLRRK